MPQHSDAINQYIEKHTSEQVIAAPHARKVVRNVVAKFTDQYGEERVIHRPRGGSGRNGLRLLTNGDTPVLLLNRAACRLIGTKIKERRIALGMTLLDVGTRAGFKSGNPKNYLWGIENAMRDNGIRVGTIYALAMALDCEIGDLMPTIAETRMLAGVEERAVAALTKISG